MNVVVGDRFGGLVVIGPGSTDFRTRARCDCGEVVDVNTKYLERGHRTSCGCRKAYSRVVNYVSAHQRVHNHHGIAVEYACAHCWRQADQWAYDHADPESLADPRGRPYSLDPDHYIPMCFECHAAFDRGYILKFRRTLYRWKQCPNMVETLWTFTLPPRRCVLRAGHTGPCSSYDPARWRRR